MRGNYPLFAVDGLAASAAARLWSAQGANSLDVAWQVLLVVALLRCCGWGLVRYLAVCFFVLLAPSSRVVPIVEEWAAERRGYLASAGPQILVLLAAYYGLVNVSGAGKRVVLKGSVLVLCTGLALGAGTLDRNHNYRSALWPLRMNCRAIPIRRSIVTSGLCNTNRTSRGSIPIWS